MAATVHLSHLLRRAVVDTRGDSVGRVDDVIVRIVDGYPPVTGIAARLGGHDVYVPADHIAALAGDAVQLAKPVVDVRRFERRPGEVLLRQDVLRHRLIDVDSARLVRAWDVVLEEGADGWFVRFLDTRRPARAFGLIPEGHGRGHEDWKSFEPLIGHRDSALHRGRFGRLRRLRPAQIADLLEDASKEEESEILTVVHEDPELEADVFEELGHDDSTRLLVSHTDEEVAGILAHMRADDAADAVADLPQARRQPVLDLLPAGQRVKVLRLMGFNPASAGGLMGLDFLLVAAEATVGEALAAVAAADGLEPETLTTVYSADHHGRLSGAVHIARLLRADPATPLRDVTDHHPVCVEPDADVTDLALLMSDFNLVAVPVVDAEHVVVGVVTVDDVLEVTIPVNWRRRERSTRPELHDDDDDPSEPGRSSDTPSPLRSP